jgi:SAM-dependent methyltransferase
VNDVEVARLAAIEDGYWWHRARRAIVCGAIRRYCPRPGRIIDVGCGPGGTSIALRDFGAVIGVDFSTSSVRTAAARGIPAARMDALRLALADGAFGLAVALDVIEHLDDDVAALAEMRRVVRPGGCVVISVPAYQFLWSDHDVALGHRRRYTRGMLRERLERAGWHVEHCGYVMPALFPVSATVRLAERALRRRRPPSEAESTVAALPAPLSALAARVMAFPPVGHALDRIPFGASVLAVGRRPERPAGSAGPGADD